MIHYIVSFFYVMAGAAAAIMLPQLFGWVRGDLAVAGAVIGVLAIANIHFIVVQSERVRRGLHGLAQIQSRLQALETRSANLDRKIGTSGAESDRRIAQTVEEVKIVQQLLERFLGTRPPTSKKARLEALVSAKAPPPARGPDANPQRRLSAEPEEFSVRRHRR